MLSLLGKLHIAMCKLRKSQKNMTNRVNPYYVYYIIVSDEGALHSSQGAFLPNVR